MARSLIGTTIAQYQVVAKLGQGPHSVVYKAWQPSLERYVALKILNRYDEKTLHKFQAEARLTAHLIQQGVPHIRQLYEVGWTSDGLLFVALDYVEDSLSGFLHRTRDQGRQIDPSAAARLLQPVAEALDAVHKLGWVHLDIKPQNILITQDGRALLADFGIAQQRGTTTHACTPLYASPEQAAGDRPVGPWSDIYSLGVVLYEMVAGQPPFEADQDIVILSQHLELSPAAAVLRRSNPVLSRHQERAILKALAKAPDKRHKTAGSLMGTMLQSDTRASSLRHTPVRVHTGSSRGGQPVRRLVLAAGLIVLMVLLFLLAQAMWLRLPTVGPEETRLPATAVWTSPQPAGETPQPLATEPRPSAVPSTPSPTPWPTVTLAPTATRTPRPTATRTAEPTPQATPLSTP